MELELMVEPDRAGNGEGQSGGVVLRHGQPGLKGGSELLVQRSRAVTT